MTTAPAKPKPKPKAVNPEVAANDAAIAQMYGALAGDLRAGLGAQNAAFGTARGLVGSAYDQMTNDLRTQANSTAGGLGSQLDMLGIGAAKDAATADLRDQLNQALISASRRKATETAGLASQSASYRAAGNEGVGNVLREGAMVRADARTRLEAAIQELEAAKAQAQAQVDIQKLQGDIQLAQMRAARRGGGGGGGGRGNPLEGLRAQMLGLQILKAQRDLEGGGGNDPWSKSGQGGLNKFLSNPSGYWSAGAGPRVRGALENIISGASAQAINPATIATGLRDPFTIAMGMVNQQRNVKTDFYRNALRQGLQIYYGKAR